jgi:hypothetical protein
MCFLDMILNSLESANGNVKVIRQSRCFSSYKKHQAQDKLCFLSLQNVLSNCPFRYNTKVQTTGEVVSYRNTYLILNVQCTETAQDTIIDASEHIFHIDSACAIWC